MTAPVEDAQAPAGRRWWLKMLLWSAALAAVLLGLVLIAPIIRLHYYAWHFRKHQDRKSFNVVAKWAAERRASTGQTIRLMGEPDGGKSDVSLCYCLYVDIKPPPPNYPGGLRIGGQAYTLFIEDGRVVQAVGPDGSFGPGSSR